MKKKTLLLIALLTVFILTAAGCMQGTLSQLISEQEDSAKTASSQTAASAPDEETSENAVSESETDSENMTSEDMEVSGDPEAENTVPDNSKKEQFHFQDTDGNEYETETDQKSTLHNYDRKLFVHDGSMLTYNDPDYQTCIGIDVSSHQDLIDWQQVKDSGIQFVFVRIGYRGYGPEGTLTEDEYALENIDGARKAGLLVGGYFFSQATDEDEAVEEARFAMSILEGRDLELPLVFDAEHIKDDTARTDNVTGEQFSKNAAAFCETVTAGGYEPMIYANLLWEAFVYDMEALSEYPFWYADYEAVPQTPYDFEFWQYSETGNINGIDGCVDMDIWMKQ